MIAPSGYHDTAALLASFAIGAWLLDVGLLPDGRYCVDYHNGFNGERTRHYFSTEADARAEAEAFTRP